MVEYTNRIDGHVPGYAFAILVLEEGVPKYERRFQVQPCLSLVMSTTVHHAEVLLYFPNRLNVELPLQQ